MDSVQNPYESPSVAAAQELVPRYTPDSDAFARYLAANRFVSSSFVAIGFGPAIIVVVMSFLWKWTPPPDPVFGAILGAFVAVGIAGVYQRRHSLVAMIVTSAISTAFVSLLLASAFIGILRGAIVGNANWGTASMAALFICGLSWLFITPLRLLIQAWRWRSAGVDLGALEKQLEGRPATKESTLPHLADTPPPAQR